MGMYALIEETREKELAAAIEAANQWQKVGRTIILASLHVQRAEDDLWQLYRDGHKSYFYEAKDCVDSAFESLREMLDSIRDNFLSDQRKSWDPDLGDDEAEAVDAFNDELGDKVVSVRDLEKLVEREDYDAFVRGEQ